MTRNGKIARLPLAVRQQLNQRLQNGDLAQDSSPGSTNCGAQYGPDAATESLLPPKSEPD